MGPADDLLRGSVSTLRQLLSSGAASPVELVEMSLRRIDEIDGSVGAFTEVLDAEARQAAAAIKPGDHRPLAGIPLAVKENRDVAGALVLAAGGADDAHLYLLDASGGGLGGGGLGVHRERCLLLFDGPNIWA